MGILLRFDRHAWVRGNLSAYIDRALDARSAGRLEAHVHACESCRAELEELRATVRSVRALPEFQAPRSFALTLEQVASRSPKSPPQPPRFWTATRTLQTGATAAAVLFVALIVGDITTRGSKSVEPTAPSVAYSVESPTTAAGTTLAERATSPGGARTATAEEPAMDSAEADPMTATTELSTGTSVAPSPTGSPMPAVTATRTAREQPTATATGTATATATATLMAPVTTAPTRSATPSPSAPAEESVMPAATSTGEPPDGPATAFALDSTRDAAEQDEGLADAPAQGTDDEAGAPVSAAVEDANGRVGWRVAQVLAGLATVVFVGLLVRRRVGN
jgi:hypothetical protein